MVDAGKMSSGTFGVCVVPVGAEAILVAAAVTEATTTSSTDDDDAAGDNDDDEASSVSICSITSDGIVASISAAACSEIDKIAFTSSFTVDSSVGVCPDI